MRAAALRDATEEAVSKLQISLADTASLSGLVGIYAALDSAAGKRIMELSISVIAPSRVVRMGLANCTTPAIPALGLPAGTLAPASEACTVRDFHERLRLVVRPSIHALTTTFGAKVLAARDLPLGSPSTYGALMEARAVIERAGNFYAPEELCRHPALSTRLLKELEVDQHLHPKFLDAMADIPSGSTPLDSTARPSAPLEHLRLASLQRTLLLLANEALDIDRRERQKEVRPQGCDDRFRA